MPHDIKFEDFEHAVMTKLLEGNDPVLRALQKQYTKAYVEKREMTSMGFFSSFRYKGPVEQLENHKNFLLGDVAGTINNEGINLDLFIENGVITTLKGTILGVPWPEHIYTLELEYWGDGGKRNMELLRSSYNNNPQSIRYDPIKKKLTIKK